ncbi:MAG: SufE family protein [Pseudomonadota bacterium]
MTAETANPLTTETNIEEIVENFQMLDDWDDRYGYLIELGRALKPMPEAAQNDANKVNGCVSQVWVTPVPGEDGAVGFRGASDAHIVSGLVAIALTLFSGRTPADIVATDEQEVFQSIGLAEHLTPQRSNGLRAMVSRIKTLAQAAA